MTEISRRQFAVYLVAVVLVVLLGGRALRADAGPGAPAPDATAAFPARGGPAPGDGAGAGSTGPTGTSGAALTTATDRLLVHVAGAVRRPGVYELPAGSRLQDAVARAGGGRDRADLDALNLAAKLTDGQQVLVARRTGTPSAGGSTGAATPAAAGAGAVAASGGVSPGASAAAGAGPTVDVNQADATQLEVLDGVGPAIALKIIDWRTQNGPFKTVEDLALVPGIGPKKLEAMRAQVTT